MKNSIKAVFVIIGTVIGAGFASGQEIYSFFNVYKENGILGIIIASILISLVIYNVLKSSNRLNVESYSNLLEKIKLPKKVIYMISLIINLFLLVSFYIMVTGFAAYFKQEFNIPKIITTIVISILSYITFMSNIDGIAKINSIIIPILILIVFVMGFKTNITNTILDIKLNNISLNLDWILKSIEYAGYNTILLIPMLINLKKYTVNNEKKVATISGLIFFIITIIIFMIMFKFSDIGNIEIPLTYIASKYGSLYKYAYGIVIIFAIYTTLISAGYGFLTNCTKNKKSYKKLALIMCIFSLFANNFSFSELVNITYPVFGILGVIQLIFITFKNINCQKLLKK